MDTRTVCQGRICPWQTRTAHWVGVTLAFNAREKKYIYEKQKTENVKKRFFLLNCWEFLKNYAVNNVKIFSFFFSGNASLFPGTMSYASGFSDKYGYADPLANNVK